MDSVQWFYGNLMYILSRRNLRKIAFPNHCSSINCDHYIVFFSYLHTPCSQLANIRPMWWANQIKPQLTLRAWILFAKSGRLTSLLTKEIRHFAPVFETKLLKTMAKGYYKAASFWHWSYLSGFIALMLFKSWIAYTTIALKLCVLFTRLTCRSNTNTT